MFLGSGFPRARALFCSCIALALFACGAEEDPPAGLNIQPLDRPERRQWPTQGWREAAPEEVGIDPERLEAAVQFAFEAPSLEAQAGEEGADLRTLAVLGVRNGRLIAERYADGFPPETKHKTWSISKAIANALIGIAEREGRLQIDDPLHPFFPGLRESARQREITFRHALHFSTGILWDEGYESSPLRSSVVAMLYTRGRENMAKFVSEQGMRADPGTYVYYSSGDTNLLMGALKKLMPAEEYRAYPWTVLFDPLGIDAVFETDASGTFVGSSYAYMSARDLAKFGFLYLNDGVWNGERILPEGWVQFTRTPAPAYSEDSMEGETSAYTAQWYANTGFPAAELPPAMPDAPANTFYTRGHSGQRMFVLPDQDMIVVRFGADAAGASFDQNGFVSRVVASATE